jgi:AcrR family transcriptional regulator
VRTVGRPSLAAQRTAEILDAYARCVRKHGLEGATLERVAEESGYSRGHIRHYLGNRDEMRSALITRTMSDYVALTRGINESLEQGQRAYGLVDLLFGPAFAPSSDDVIIDALWAASYDDLVKRQLRDTYLQLEKAIHSALRGDFPGAAAAVYRDAAYQLLALAFGHWSMSELEFPASRERGARRLAESVIKKVETASELRA